MNYQPQIKDEINKFLELRRRLTELYPDLDDQTLSDTLEGATNLHEAIAALIRSALEDEDLVKALKERMSALRARLDRLDKRATEKRRVACETMEATQIRKLLEADFSASLRKGPPAVDIMDETTIPMEFLIPQPPKPDRRGILEALSGGRQVPGAALSTPRTSLSVRSQ
jgi:hypothetical protein